MNIEDYQLLFEAGKALGGVYTKHALGGYHLAFGPNWNGFSWNPLENNNDAFKLMVQLSLHVRVCTRIVMVEARELGDDSVEKLNPDPQASVRRAIVRAAALIGKSKIEKEEIS